MHEHRQRDVRGRAEAVEAEAHAERKLDTASARFDGAHDLMAGHDGRPMRRQGALDDLQVGPADAARAHRNEHLARTWCVEHRRARGRCDLRSHRWRSSVHGRAVVMRFIPVFPDTGPRTAAVSLHRGHWAAHRKKFTMAVSTLAPAGSNRCIERRVPILAS
jgi:hypothetical protein